MKQFRRFSALRRLLPLFLAGTGLLISGCASFHDAACTQFEENRKEADYATQYRFQQSDSENAARHFKPLPKESVAAVRMYRMRIDTPKIEPCRHLVLYKEFYLQRRNRANLTLQEIREFYTADGVLIATKVETISDQLRATGYYTGDTTLPIPEKAPPGKYRIVSKLVLQGEIASRATLLAKTSASFQVVSKK